LSGHAGIAAALATAAMPLYPKLRLPLAGLVATVGVSRVYVGAHLPLDVVGGVALGVTVDAAVNALIGTS
jgi:undecaprenyl-diphosphatase